MGAFSRSWQITKLTFNIMRQDKELFLFPVVASIFSLAFIIAMVFPTIVTAILAGNSNVGSAFFYAILFIVYFGLALIATFFNVCVVYTVKKRFSGGDATFGESIKFAFSRLGIIVSWSLLSATVGIILRAIDSFAERFGFVGELIIKITTSIVGAAWAIVTVFVVPSMVYKNVGPIDAIKDSAQSLRKTWGESIIRVVGFGLVQGLFFVLGLVVFIVLSIVALHSVFAFISIVTLAVIYFVALFTFFSIADKVFNTALYSYAQTGKVPQGYDEDLIKTSFRKK